MRLRSVEAHDAAFGSRDPPVAFEDWGLIGGILDWVNRAVSYRDASVGDLTDPVIARAGMLVVLGELSGVYESAAYPFLDREVALLERPLARDLPTLGSCLGS